jgi:hypothetical protein
MNEREARAVLDKEAVPRTPENSALSDTAEEVTQGMTPMQQLLALAFLLVKRAQRRGE